MDGAAPRRVVITREEAQAKGLERYFSGEPCYQRHVAERRVEDNRCYECIRLRQRDEYTHLFDGLPKYPQPWPNDGGTKRVSVVNSSTGRTLKIGWVRCLSPISSKRSHLFFSTDIHRVRVCPSCKQRADDAHHFFKSDD